MPMWPSRLRRPHVPMYVVIRCHRSAPDTPMTGRTRRTGTRIERNEDRRRPRARVATRLAFHSIRAIRAVPIRSEGAGDDLLPDRELRHLTVMFCDIVGSTPLQARLDAEDWDDIVSAYHQSCEAVVCRFDGYVAEKPGDGLVAYFGWPTAHEDGAERAVRAGLGIIDAHAGPECLPGARPRRQGARADRDGQGTVVVGATENGQRGDLRPAALTNAAFRLQEIAEPDTVVISGTTLNLGPAVTSSSKTSASKHLANIAIPVQAYRVIGGSGVDQPLMPSAIGLTPLIGRESDARTSF